MKTIDTDDYKGDLIGFYEEVEKFLKDGLSCLKHLMLHEIGHAKGIPQSGEKEADKYAFAEMDKKGSGIRFLPTQNKE